MLSKTDSLGKHEVNLQNTCSLVRSPDAQFAVLRCPQNCSYVPSPINSKFSDSRSTEYYSSAPRRYNQIACTVSSWESGDDRKYGISNYQRHSLQLLSSCLPHYFQLFTFSLLLSLLLLFFLQPPSPSPGWLYSLA